MKAVIGCLVAGAIVPTFAAELSWEVRAEFDSLKADDRDVAVLRLADGRTIEVPVSALSPAGQAAVRSAVEDSEPDAAGARVVTVQGPFGRSVPVPVPESIKLIESDAIHCRTAVDAADVYRLALADERLSGEPRQAAEARLREWVAMAEQGLVRLGDRWVSPEQARAAADEASRLIGHSLELMRQGTAEIAEEDLRKAARINPEDKRANFVMGLAYALVARNPGKAADQFMEVIRRDPEDTAALVNVAVAELSARRYATSLEHFRKAASQASDLQSIVDNVSWAVRSAGVTPGSPAGMRAKIPEKTVAEINALYRTLTQDRKLKPAEGVAGPQFLGPDGKVCSASSLADVARLWQSDSGRPLMKRSALGFAVGRGHVVCPRHAVVGHDGGMLGEVTIELPADRGRRLKPAILVAAPEDSGVALLRCDDLDVEPLPLASKERSSPEITVVDRAEDSWLDVRLEPARGRIVASDSGGPPPQRFVHTAVVPRGLGGAPILDADGRVVGMVAPAPRTDASGNGAGFAIPAERILPVVDELPADLRTVRRSADKAGGVQKAVAAVVIVTAAAPVDRPGVSR